MGATADPALPSRPGLLDELARLGPHFALESHPADSAPPGGWRPFAELLDDLAGRIAVVRAALAVLGGRSAGQVELRVAVSMTQLGLTGRLVCPALGVAVLTGGLLDLDPAGLYWKPGPGNAVALSVPAQAIPAAGPPRPDLAEALADTVLAGPVRLLAEAGSRYEVSPQVLWGNVASVVHGVPGLLGAGAPDLRSRADALVTGLLNRPPLRGTSQGPPGAGFRRRSCCLVYRLAPAEPGRAGAAAGVCGDCVLEPGAGNRGH
ncbi:MAG: hypothetical protein QOE23_2708 [Pseudonocardiales bacterium]|nr:hypothetical protein [Pseudonocardiales bacterium]